MPSSDKLLKLAKIIASSGITSRRKAEQMIVNGLVKVEGCVINNVAMRVSIDANICINDQKINCQLNPKIWLYYKPRGTIVTHHDPQNRQSIFDLLPKNMKQVISVGRLDFNSEGLLLLTNNGDISYKIASPYNQWLREYRVRCFGNLNQDKFMQLMHGVKIEGVIYKPVSVKLVSDNIVNMNKNFWLDIVLQDGKNREIHKLMEFCGVQVNKLIRVQYGPFSVDGLSIGDLICLPQEMINLVMKDLQLL